MIYKPHKGEETGEKRPAKRREKPLTARQKAFARERANGGTLIESYRRAGYSAKQTDKAAKDNAFRLSHTAKIQAEIDRLQKQADNGYILSRQQRLAMLSDFAANVDGDTGKKDRLRALDMLAKMSGDYSETIVSHVSAAIETDRQAAFNEIRRKLDGV